MPRGRPKKPKSDDKLSEDLIAEIADKDWPVSALSTDDIKKEKKKNSVSRTVVNKGANKVYNKPKKQKEGTEEFIPEEVKREQVNPFDYIKLPDGYNEDYFKAFLPSRTVFFSAAEEKDFYTMINVFILDFDISELTASDIQDIIDLCLNRKLESRLFDSAATNPNLLLDIAPTIEKFRKQSDQVKKNLANRRTDRVDVKNKQSFSIVDIVTAYDDKKKQEFEERVKIMEEEEQDFWKDRRSRD